MRDSLTRLWSVHEGFTIRGIGDRLFAVQFFSKRDQEKVMLGRPWLFDGCLLALEHASPTLHPREMPFRSSPFWLCFMDLPLGYWSRDFAEIVGNACGHFLYNDSAEPVGWTYYMRVWILIDLTKSVRRGIRIYVGHDKTKWVSIQYERMPLFCFLCGFVGHHYHDCELYDKEKNYDESSLPYGTWLKAESGGPNGYQQRSREAERARARNRFPVAASKQKAPIVTSVTAHHTSVVGASAGTS